MKTEKWLQPYCKPCAKEYKDNWYKENSEHVKKESKLRKVRNKEFILKYLFSHSCVDCGESDPIVLEFDHLRDKIKEVSVMGDRGNSTEIILKEIEKCEVVCANDHKRRTAQRINSYRFRGIGVKVNTADFQSVE